MTPEQYITENYSDIRKWLYNITKGEKSHLYDDFIHEVLMIFLQHKRAQEAVDTGTARYFLARIGLNQWRSSTSPFHYQYRDSFLDYTEKETEAEEYDVRLDIMEELAMYGLDEMYRGTESSRYEAIIIMLYHANGSNYSEVGRQLNMKHTTIRKIYLRGIEKLKTIINNRINRLKDGTIELNPDLTALITNWDIVGDHTFKSTVSMASQIFKTRYFDPA